MYPDMLLIKINVQGREMTLGYLLLQHLIIFLSPISQFLYKIFLFYKASYHTIWHLPQIPHTIKAHNSSTHFCFRKVADIRFKKYLN